MNNLVNVITLLKKLQCRVADVMTKVFAVIAVLIILFAICGWFVRGRYLSSLVTVTLHNAAKHPVKEIRLTHERGVVLINGIKCGESRTIKFDPRQAESVYSLQIEFQNGKKLKDRGVYIERGDRIDETITENGFKNRFF